MSRYKPEKLTVEFRKGVTETVPVIPGRYTLTNSDITAESFLTIGPDYAFDNNAMEYHVLIDEKIGDVTGDGVPDWVSLYGDRMTASPYVTNIRLEVEDGQTGFKIDIDTGLSGYNPTLFLGDFTKDKIDDIKLSMDAGGSGGYGIFAVYTCINDELNTVFTSDGYNSEYQYMVEYRDLYKVGISNEMLNRLFTLDISDKGYDYLSQFYNLNGILIKPVNGEVLALGALIPIIGSEKDNSFDLLAFQRIIGSTNADTLGHIENLLSWDGERFASIRMTASVPGTDLIM